MPPVDRNADLLPHEIAGPVWYLPYPLPVMIVAGAVLLLLLAVAVWALVRWGRNRAKRILTAQEKALAALAAVHAEAEQVAPYLLSVEVCDILRHFLLEEHHIPATTQTSYEFLQSAQGLVAPIRLRCFLEKADAIKFAHAPATSTDNLELVDLANSIVKGEPDAVAA